MQSGIKSTDVQRDFLKYTGQRIKADLQKNHPQVLERFKVNAKDRQYPHLNGRAGVLGKKFVEY